MICIRHFQGVLSKPCNSINSYHSSLDIWWLVICSRESKSLYVSRKAFLFFMSFITFHFAKNLSCYKDPFTVLSPIAIYFFCFCSCPRPIFYTQLPVGRFGMEKVFGILCTILHWLHWYFQWYPLGLNLNTTWTSFSWILNYVWHKLRTVVWVFRYKTRKLWFWTVTLLLFPTQNKHIQEQEVWPSGRAATFSLKSIWGC